MSYNEIDKYAITISDLSKKYTIIHKTDKNKKIEDSSFYALKNINLKIIKGESVGLIGENGSGKSTLLKVLSQITVPTSGTAVINGKIASVLEIGMGFHPELSGRENIYLSGALLGLRKKQIKLLYDDIVAFSEIGNYIDSPVKHYSSGMYLRLAFSVVAHLDVDILMFDEVFSVGDFGFQRKCIAKIRELISGNKTLIIVSHNLNDIVKLCERTIFIDKGKVISDGNTNDVIGEYLNLSYSKSDRLGMVGSNNMIFESEFFSLLEVVIKSDINVDEVGFSAKKEVEILFNYFVKRNEIIVIPGFSIFYLNNMILCSHLAESVDNVDNLKKISKLGNNKIKTMIPANLFNNKDYVINIFFDIVFPDLTKKMVDVGYYFLKIKKTKIAYWEKFAEGNEAAFKPEIGWMRIE